MKAFLGEDFLLSNDVSRRLYHEVAKDLPIFDYHCHLDPKEIAQNRQFENIAQLWFESDHYKWRAMRALGIEEKYITGAASDREKYDMWADVVPQCLGNPLYHWTHMELKRPFGIGNTVFNASTADKVWSETQEKLQSPEISAQGILKQMNVAFIGTTDDPIDSLQYHKSIAEDPSFGVQVSPTWRPDRAIKIGDVAFAEYVTLLSESSDCDITSFETFLSALEHRMQFFADHGCCSADHSLEQVYFERAGEGEINVIFQKALEKKTLSENEIAKYTSELYLRLAERYTKLGWVMQLHIGAQRNNSKRMFNTLGRDAGFDSISDQVFSVKLSQLLDAMDANQQLPKTILYSLNPAANEMLATLAGNFQEAGVKGKMQFGSAWWFNDQKDGILRQLEQVSQLGVLSTFVGMLTDSRSLLSYIRHEYFRRLLCNKVGCWVEQGEVPNESELLDDLIKKVCFENAQHYFTH